MGTFKLEARRKPPLLNASNSGGYLSEIPPSGNITIFFPSLRKDSACFNARNEENLLARLTGISTLLKKNPVTGLSSNSTFPINDIGIGHAFSTAVISRIEL